MGSPLLALPPPTYSISSVTTIKSRVPIYAAERKEVQYITYQRKQRGIIFTAAHKRNTKPLNVCPRVLRYTLLNSIAPRNWEMTLKMPYAQNKDPAKRKIIITEVMFHWKRNTTMRSVYSHSTRWITGLVI